MSTKSTVAHGAGFHFYHEVLDDDHVYLELRTTNFEAGYGRVMVQIPVHIWEVIRHLGGARLDLVDKSDEELLTIVDSEVDARIERYRTALDGRPERAALVGMLGSLVYGGAELPREEQTVNGMRHYRAERQRQREVHAAILELRAAQRSGS